MPLWKKLFGLFGRPLPPEIEYAVIERRMQRTGSRQIDGRRMLYVYNLHLDGFWKKNIFFMFLFQKFFAVFILLLNFYIEKNVYT